ncbi:SDH family Clp fold serine proteinase [Bradyrhizobium elkanii]
MAADAPAPPAPAPAAAEEQFPRSTALPKQSPLFWVAEKDRYLRQLMIRDIQALTGRTLLVYFASMADQRAQISLGDEVYFTEMLRDAKGGPVDLLIETPGGYTDPTEKIASLLRTLAPDLRVIVPCRAKSNGTMLALVGSNVVMGPASELGPADPFISLGPNNIVPAHFLIGVQGVDPVFVQAAQHAIAQTMKLAETLLTTGMMKGKQPGEITSVVQALASRQQYPSHGSVIDADEAMRLGLSVTKLGSSDDLWQRLWLLRCMYEHDARRAGAIKIFEGPSISNSLRAA